MTFLQTSPHPGGEEEETPLQILNSDRTAVTIKSGAQGRTPGGWKRGREREREGGKYVGLLHIKNTSHLLPGRLHGLTKRAIRGALVRVTHVIEMQELLHFSCSTAEDRRPSAAGTKVTSCHKDTRRA